MRRRTQLFLAIVACLFVGNVLFAGDGHDHDDGKRHLALIYQEFVKPGMESQYEASVKKMIEVFAENEVSPEMVSWHTVSGPDIGYTYVMTIGENYAGMDAMHKRWGEAMDAVGEETMTELMKATDACVERRESFVVLRKNELCYTPEHKEKDMSEVMHLDYNFFHVIPGHEQAIEKIGKQYAELYTKHGIDTGYSVYASVIGSDLPSYAVIKAGASAEAIEAKQIEIAEKLGEAGAALSEQVMQHVREHVHTTGTIRPDLSYVPSH